MKLTRSERKQAFAGTLRVLRRPKNPGHESGTQVILSHTQGGKQVLYPGNDFQSRKAHKKLLEEGKPVTVDVPKKPNLWITIKGWHLKQGSTEWETAVTITDLREPTRMLSGSAPTGVPRQAGMKTRWGQTVDVEGVSHAKKVPAKGTQTESFTTETERGYGGGGRSAVDEAAAVDDGTLTDFSRRVAEENKLRQERKPVMADKLREERKMASEFRKGKKSAGRAAQRRAERAAKRDPIAA